MSIADTRDFGILRIIVNDTDGAIGALKGAGYVTLTSEVLAAKIEDKPGGLASVLTALGEAGVSLEYLYAFVSRKEGSAYVVLRVEDTDNAAGALSEKGVPLVSSDELFES
jgi:hypothetical protein